MIRDCFHRTGHGLVTSRCDRAQGQMPTAPPETQDVPIPRHPSVRRQSRGESHVPRPGITSQTPAHRAIARTRSCLPADHAQRTGPCTIQEQRHGLAERRASLARTGKPTHSGLRQRSDHARERHGREGATDRHVDVPFSGVKKGSGRSETREGLQLTPTPTKMSGGDLLSHTLPSAVPSAQSSLASGFGMEPGVSSTL